MYRFGDGTPFPLVENFIETIVAAVDCCVAIFHRDSEAEAREERQRLSRRAADDELKRLDALKVLIETAVTPLLHKKDRPGRASQVAAQKIYDAASQIIRQSRLGVSRRRDTVSMEIAPPPDEAVVAALEQFFRSHALPRTEWRLRWSAGDGKASADVGAQATRELDLAFDVAIPADSEWAHPLSVSTLLHGVPIPSVVELRGKRRTMNLDTFTVTEVHVAPGRVAMVLRESSKKASAGLHIVMPHSSDTAPLVVALDKHDQPKSQPFCLDEQGSVGIHALWAAIEARIPALLAARSNLVSARLGGQEVGDLAHPAVLAEAILMALAPLLREMRMRSMVPGELILKRHLGGDRREELFVPRRVLLAKIATLGPRHRQVFEAVGLSEEGTSDFVTRIGRRPPPPMPRRQMARGTVSAETQNQERLSATHDSVSVVTDADSRLPSEFRRDDSDPLGQPLRPRPPTNGPTFEPEITEEPTMPKSATMVSGVIDAIRIIRSRAQA